MPFKDMVIKYGPTQPYYPRKVSEVPVAEILEKLKLESEDEKLAVALEKLANILLNAATEFKGLANELRRRPEKTSKRSESPTVDLYGVTPPRR